jgi:hypothetical protein
VRTSRERLLTKLAARHPWGIDKRGRHAREGNAKMLPTQMPEDRSHVLQVSSARRQGHRVLLAILTLVLTVLTVIGIQAIANRVTAPPRPAVAVEALGTGTSVAAQGHGIGPAVLIVAIVVLMGAVKLVSRMRATSPKHTYWDDMPW